MKEAPATAQRRYVGLGALALRFVTHLSQVNVRASSYLVKTHFLLQRTTLYFALHVTIKD